MELSLFFYTHLATKMRLKQQKTKEERKKTMLFKRLKMLVGALLILTGLNACTTNTNGNYCLLYEPIYADYEADTAETIRQIDRNNVVYDAVCAN